MIIKVGSTKIVNFKTTGSWDIAGHGAGHGSENVNV